MGGGRGVTGTGGLRPDPTATSPVSWAFRRGARTGALTGQGGPERTAQAAQARRPAEQRGARRPFIEELVTNTVTRRGPGAQRGNSQGPDIGPRGRGLGEEPALGGAESPQGPPPRPPRLPQAAGAGCPDPGCVDATLHQRPVGGPGVRLPCLGELPEEGAQGLGARLRPRGSPATSQKERGAGWAQACASRARTRTPGRQSQDRGSSLLLPSAWDRMCREKSPVWRKRRAPRQADWPEGCTCGRGGGVSHRGLPGPGAPGAGSAPRLPRCAAPRRSGRCTCLSLASASGKRY